MASGLAHSRRCSGDTEAAPCDLNHIEPVAESCHNVTSQDAEAYVRKLLQRSATGETAQLQEDSAVAPEDLGFIEGAIGGLAKRWLFHTDLAFYRK